jgi:hypothetical protein
MSLFDDFVEEGLSPREYGPQEGFAGVLLCASACDGHIADEEARSLNLVLGRRRLYERLTQQQFGSMMDRLLAELKRSGPEQLLNKCYEAVPPELRETVFANAVDIVLADGIVEQEEKEFIDDLGMKFDIDKKRAKAIIQVMVYKNRG